MWQMSRRITRSEQHWVLPSHMLCQPLKHLSPYLGLRYPHWHVTLLMLFEISRTFLWDGQGGSRVGSIQFNSKRPGRSTLSLAQIFPLIRQHLSKHTQPRSAQVGSWVIVYDYLPRNVGQRGVIKAAIDQTHIGALKIKSLRELCKQVAPNLTRSGICSLHSSWQGTY